MIGKDFHKEFHLGESVRVCVLNADMETRTIDFILEEDILSFMNYE